MKYLFIILTLAVCLTSCANRIVITNPEVVEPERPVKVIESSDPLNVILLIGDGMGLTEVSTRYYFGEGDINFDRFNDIGLINTSSAIEKVTDSAAGATAFATGKRTYNGAISMGLDSSNLKTIVEALSEDGFKTGIISTSAITHATPACFYAHNLWRRNEEDIAMQLLESDVDFFAGGGLRFFNRRSDSLNILPGLTKFGYTLSTKEKLNSNQKLSPKKKYIFLPATAGMPKMTEGRGDFLPDATKLALDYLSSSDERFFLMVEGSQIDWGGHANDSEYIITETADFDKTIGVALDFAARNKNTLVVVTADHETGGYSLSAGTTNGSPDYNKIEPSFSTGGHSSTLIPVFAKGPKSEYFRGIYDNTDIYHKIMKALGK